MSSRLMRVLSCTGGRTVLVQPLTQIVSWILACVTSGLSAPGTGGRSSHLAAPTAAKDQTRTQAAPTLRPGAPRSGAARRPPGESASRGARLRPARADVAESVA